MKTILKIVSLSIILSFSAMARDGSSGCGPGWYVFKKNSLVSSSLRSTTNGILAPSVTIGMTLGTSNCTKHSIVKTEKRTIHFVTHNINEIKAEAAKGNGDFLSAYASTIGCKTKDHSYFSSKIQSNFEKVFQDKASNEEVIIETYKIILSDQRLVHSCSLS